MDLSTGLEAIRPWLTTGGIGAILAFVLKFYLDNRRLGIEAQTKLHKVKMEENGDERAGWGVLIAALQDDIRIVRENHRQCETRLAQVEAELNGVHKQIISLSAREAVQIPASPAIRRAAESATRHAGGGNDED